MCNHLPGPIVIMHKEVPSDASKTTVTYGGGGGGGPTEILYALPPGYKLGRFASWLVRRAAAKARRRRT